MTENGVRLVAVLGGVVALFVGLWIATNRWIPFEAPIWRMAEAFIGALVVLVGCLHIYRAMSYRAMSK